MPVAALSSGPLAEQRGAGAQLALEPVDLLLGDAQVLVESLRMLLRLRQLRLQLRDLELLLLVDRDSGARGFGVCLRARRASGEDSCPASCAQLPVELAPQRVQRLVPFGDLCIGDCAPALNALQRLELPLAAAAQLGKIDRLVADGGGTLLDIVARCRQRAALRIDLHLRGEQRVLAPLEFRAHRGQFTLGVGEPAVGVRRDVEDRGTLGIELPAQRLLPLLRRFERRLDLGEALVPALQPALDFAQLLGQIADAGWYRRQDERICRGQRFFDDGSEIDDRQLVGGVEIDFFRRGSAAAHGHAGSLAGWWRRCAAPAAVM